MLQSVSVADIIGLRFFSEPALIVLEKALWSALPLGFWFGVSVGQGRLLARQLRSIGVAGD